MICKVFGATTSLCFLMVSGMAGAAVPGQFIAKMYSEVLGRCPDASGWTSEVNYFNANGCNQQTLTAMGASFFSSAEFTNLGYDNSARTLILYRAILNREPDAVGFSTYYNDLQNGTSLSTLVSAFFSSTEFSRMVGVICGAHSYSFDYYGQGPANPIAIPTPNPQSGQASTDEQTLQNYISGTPPGSTFYLQQEAVFILTQPLMIPPGVTVATAGNPDIHHHALMARLVRASSFSSPLVMITSGSLRNVWVDGQRNYSSAYVKEAVNIEVDGGSGVVVDNNFITGTLGWSSIHSYGSLDNQPCAGNTITNNVITSYASTHGVPKKYTDGLSLGCENTVAQSNMIVDATDVGIVVFLSTPAVQKSQISYNYIVSAGNSAFGAMGFDPMNRTTTADFSGSLIGSNHLWSSPSTHFIIGLTVGTQAWFGAGGTIGTGATANSNTTDGIRTNFGEGISVSGMFNASVQSNTFTSQIQNITSCPIGNVVASVSTNPQLASGSIQAYTNALVQSCISDSSPGS